MPGCHGLPKSAARFPSPDQAAPHFSSIEKQRDVLAAMSSTRWGHRNPPLHPSSAGALTNGEAVADSQPHFTKKNPSKAA